MARATEMEWKRAVVAVLLIAGLLLLFFALRPARQNSSLDRTKRRAESKVNAEKKTTEPEQKTLVTAQLPPLSTPHPGEAPVLSMSKLLFEFSQLHRSVKDLVSYLEQTHQQPLVVANENEDTGKMTIVRTQSPLPNTRYFHAQFFSSESGEELCQHMSFEYKSSPTALSEALAAMTDSFPGLSGPTRSTADFTEWNLGDGYTAWCKRLQATDLEDDPFNSYAKDGSDVGTIRCAIEINPHDHDE